MRLQQIEISGFKSFAKKSSLSFTAPVTAVVGPNGSGKSNVVEAFRFVLGEQSMKSMRGKSGADLIFRGGTGAPKLSRAHVSITFDNSDKVFAFMPQGESSGEAKAPVLFDTVTFSRELFADGTSKYSMNGTEIKLKQMIEILSSVNIGVSGHHIISQGEADGILRANTKERREILEDALGLKIYHYRIKESESKLAKTLETLKDVQSLRRELAPHLSFLKKQVEKIEKGRVIRDDLQSALTRFLSTEKVGLSKEEIRLREAVDFIENKKTSLEKELSTLPEKSDLSDNSFFQKIEEAKTFIRNLQEKRRTVEQKIGRLEGMIEAHRAISQNSLSVGGEGPSISFAPTEYSQLLSDIEFFISSIKNATSLEMAQNAVTSLSPLIERLKARQPQVVKNTNTNLNIPDVKETVLELEALQKELSPLISKEQDLQNTIITLEKEREQALRSTAASTENRYRIASEIKQCESELQILAVTKSSFIERKERFDQEIKEAGFLFGPSFLHSLHSSHSPVGGGEEQDLDMHDLKRTIDRLKIRLEEHSGIGNDVVSEYESTKERDAFLTKEMVDIETSIKNLEGLIVDLKKVLDERFTKGVETINERFGDFFKTMFGGGSAFLSITVEKKRKKKSDTEVLDEEELEEISDAPEGFERGIDVHVNLPDKKVKELSMLSGGERSLVSIALLFAISQVNPPPFLVLDETDAALDEANSRRYGDMVERLSEYSQLILVTHNRETMSRATVLYGVTLGSDGGSKLLSIKFDEAVKVAK
ncbi:MAG: chromosome segregation protein [Patescibacteria group bacterium]|jgi:chromosome segregation protein|nr:chromosome segregation protein [Patescibacteria group bacterium]